MNSSEKAKKIVEEYKNNRIFVGSGKERDTKYGKMLGLTLSTEDTKKILLAIKERDGKVTLNVKKRKTVSDKGVTHYIEIDRMRQD
jgi:hypothetical protein